MFILTNGKAIDFAERTSLFCLLLLVPVLSFAQLNERTGPPFWWTKMNNTQLQIMLYGENIATLKPEINFEGIQFNRYLTVGPKQPMIIEIK